LAAEGLIGRIHKIREIEGLDSYASTQENLIQWGIPFAFLFRSRFALFLFSLLSSHYLMSYKQLIGSRCILDVGCGLGLPMRVLRRLGLPSRVIGVDVHIQYLRRVKKLEIYDDRVLASAVYLPFREKSFNSVICLQVLEHLTKRDGVTALRKLSRVADTVVVTTPVSFVKADVDPRNPFQKHRSAWYPEDLEHLGYMTKGYGWFRITKHSCLAPLLVLMNIILIPMLRGLPRLAYHMYAVKRH